MTVPVDSRKTGLYLVRRPHLFTVDFKRTIYVTGAYIACLMGISLDSALEYAIASSLQSAVYLA